MIIIKNLFPILFIVTTSFVIGTILFKFFKNLKEVSIIFKLAIGLGVIGYLIMLLGVFDLYNRTAFILFFIALILIYFILEGKKLSINLDKVNFKITHFTSSEKIIFILLIFILLISLFEVFAPATSEDSLTYHFKIPYDYVDARGLIYVKSSLYNMPHLLQMLYIVSFLFGGNEIGCHLINYYICLLFLAVLYKFSKSLFSRKVALFTLLIVSTLPMFTFIKISGRVEVGLTLFLILGIFSIIKFLHSKKIEWVILSGAFLGIAAGIKYTALLYIIIFSIFLFLIILLNKSDGYRKKMSTILIFVLVGFLFSFPFYLKNYLMTGNPIYPFLYSVFGGKDWSNSLTIMSNAYFDTFKKYSLSSFFDYLILPWTFTMNGEKFLAGKNGYGFIFITFLPILIIYLFMQIKIKGIKILYNFENPINILAWIIFLGSIIWFMFSFHRGRHLFLVFVLLSIFISLIISGYFNISQIFRHQIIYKFLVKILFFSSIIFCTFISILFNFNYAKVALGLEKKEVFFERIKPQYKYFEKVNNLFKKNDKILNLLGHNQFYLKHKQFYPSPYFQGWIDWSRIKKLEDYYNKLKKNKFTYIIGYHFDNYKVLNINSHDKSIHNIVMYNHLNYELIKSHSKLIFCEEFKQYNSRTFKSSFTKRSFCVYKII